MRADMGHILENVVYLELLRRGYEVYIGKAGNAEIDFVAIGEEGEEYYQVALTVLAYWNGNLPSGKYPRPQSQVPADYGLYAADIP